MKLFKNKLTEPSAGRGSILLIVAILVAVVAVLATGVTTAVVSANSVSEQTVNSQQAYFTARSAAEATVNYIKSLTDDQLQTYVPYGSNKSSEITQLRAIT